MHDVDIARLHAIDRQSPAQHEGAERAAFHGDRFAFEVAHRPHATTAHDHVGAVGDVHHQDDPRLEPVRGESEQLIEADHHPVDRLITKSAKDFARRWILHQLHGRRFEATQLPRQVKRLAPYPYVGADAQRGFRFAHATGQQEHKRDACKSAKMSFHVQIRVHEHRGAKVRVRPLGGRGQSVAVELANEAASVGVHFDSHCPSGTKM